jgi:hypothetical protein
LPLIPEDRRWLGAGDPGFSFVILDHRGAEFALVGVIRFQADKVAHEHLYWDQATVLSQLGSGTIRRRLE